MTIRPVKLYGTTSAAGALTVTASNPIVGILKKVTWIDGTLADGVDAVISTTAANDKPAETLLTLTNANSDATYYPTISACDTAGAAVTYDGTREIKVSQIVDGILQLAVTSGGATKAGGCIVYVEE